MSIAGIQSSSSSASTEEDDPREPPFLFARLEPRNAKAYKAFAKVVDAAARDPERYRHHARFLSYDSRPVPLRSLLHGYAPEMTSDASTDEPETEEMATADGDQEVFKGGYMFSLKILPSLRLKWRAGNGRWNQDPELGLVDLLISVDMDNTGVHGLHAQFLFDEKSGIFGVRAYHRRNGITVDHNSFGSDQGLRALGFKAMIQFGDLLYEFSYTIPAGSDLDAVFRGLKRTFFEEELGGASPIEATSVTPSENDMIFGSWRLHQPVGRGTFGIVSAASRRDGPIEVVAVKHMRRYSEQSAANIELEVRSARELTSASRAHKYGQYIVQLNDVIYPRGHEFFTSGGAMDDVFLLYTPFTRGTFLSHILGDRIKVDSMDVRKALFAQIIKGLDCLHTLGWVHRDIKPPNLGIVSLMPPYAVILDLGQAFYYEPQSFHSDDSSNDVGNIQPTPGHYGTSSYISPEMESKNYGPAVDIWAAGLSGYELFVGSHPFRSSVNPWREDKNTPDQLQHNYEVLKGIHSALLAKPAGCIEHLISDMLRIRPSSRPSAAKALEHTSIAEAITHSPQQDTAPMGTKRQRE